MKYKDIKMGQVKEIVNAFKEFFNNEHFDKIIELGTGRGGLSLLIADLSGSEVITFDNQPRRVTEKIKLMLKDRGVDVRNCDIFSSGEVEEVISLPDKRILLLCDNGNKPKEVNMFSPLLKLGDVVMAHDYFPTKNHHKKQSRWKSCEITDKDIKVEDIVTCYQHIFENVFWMCRTKK